MTGEDEEEETADIVVDDEFSSVEKVNDRLPEGVYVDKDEKELNVNDESYSITNLVTQAKSKAKERGPVTYGLTVGGVTLGLLVSGPFAGAAAASGGAIIGALYDRGYLEFEDGTLNLNIGGDTKTINPEEAEVKDPFERHDNKWYEPDSDENDYAVELPDGEVRYYKTQEGAANRLIEEYET